MHHVEMRLTQQTPQAAYLSGRIDAAAEVVYRDRSGGFQRLIERRMRCVEYGEVYLVTLCRHTGQQVNHQALGASGI